MALVSLALQSHAQHAGMEGGIKNPGRDDSNRAGDLGCGCRRNTTRAAQGGENPHVDMTKTKGGRTNIPSPPKQ